jgi:hypothetical protein
VILFPLTNPIGKGEDDRDGQLLDKSRWKVEMAEMVTGGSGSGYI